MTNNNTPKLRFPIFHEEWKKNKIGELSIKVGSGSTPKGGSLVYKKTGIPFIRSQNVLNGYLSLEDIVYIDKSTHEAMASSSVLSSDVLLNITGASLGRSCVVPKDFEEGNVNQHVCIIRLKNGFHPYLISILLSTPRGFHELIKNQTGGGKEGLNFQTVRSFNVILPNKEEQQKIADFLSAVDEKISKLQKKVELLKKYKKGVMQKIFSQKIRFKDENGKDYPEWEEKSIGEIFERITERNKEDNHNVLTISAQYGLINQEKFFNKSVAASDLTGYYLLQKGDFAYNKSYSNGYPMGAIKKLNIYEKGVVSTLYICFRTKMDQDSDFYEQYFEYGLQNKEIEKIAQEGARNHGLLNISVVDFFDQIYLQVPSYDEQVRISEFLIKLDMRINLEERKLEQAKRFKKSLLQQMFI